MACCGGVRIGTGGCYDAHDAPTAATAARARQSDQRADGARTAAAAALSVSIGGCRSGWWDGDAAGTVPAARVALRRVWLPSPCSRLRVQHAVSTSADRQGHCASRQWHDRCLSWRPSVVACDDDHEGGGDSSWGGRSRYGGGCCDRAAASATPPQPGNAAGRAGGHRGRGRGAAPRWFRVAVSRATGSTLVLAADDVSGFGFFRSGGCIVERRWWGGHV